MAGGQGSALRAVISGSFACAGTLAVVAAFGARRSRPVAPINAISHVLWGEQAANAARPDIRHTVPAVAINEGASIFWAALYERSFGHLAENGQVARALLGSAGVAALAYLVDYHVVPKRLTPGWEYHLSRRPLAAVYVALALSLPVRGLLRRAMRST